MLDIWVHGWPKFLCYESVLTTSSKHSDQAVIDSSWGLVMIRCHQDERMIMWPLWQPINLASTYNVTNLQLVAATTLPYSLPFPRMCVITVFMGSKRLSQDHLKWPTLGRKELISFRHETCGMSLYGTLMWPPYDGFLHPSQPTSERISVGLTQPQSSLKQLLTVSNLPAFGIL